MKQTFSMPKLSFIVTSYNYAQYVIECLQSIVEQSYQNIEIIVVDDHSRDNSVEVINNFIEENSTCVPIHLIMHKRNKGQLASILDGIFAASGEFIACIDSDDKLHKDYALTHIGVHLCNPCALTVSEMFEIDSKSVLHSIKSPNLPEIEGDDIISKIKLRIKDLELQNIEVKKLDKKEKFFGGWWWAPTSCGVFRKSTIQPFLTFLRTDNWRTSPDKLLFNFLHLVGGSVRIYEPLVMYRRHGHNAGIGNVIMGDTRFNSGKAKKQYLKNQINLYKDILEFFEQNKSKLIDLYSRQHYYRMIKEIYFSIPKLILYKLRH